MQRRRPSWHLLLALTLLLTGSLPLVEDACGDEASPDNYAADDSAAEGAKRRAGARRLRITEAGASSVDTGALLLAQRINGTIAAGDTRVTAILPSRPLPRTYLTPRLTCRPSPTADPV